MELTGLKSFKNAGGNVYSSIGSSDSSKTIGYKQINNAGNDIDLPKFENGTPPTGVDTSGITSNVYSQTTYGMPSVKQYFSSPAATVGAKSISAPTIPSTGSKGGGFNTSPGTKSGGFNVSGIGSVVTSGVQFAGDAINSFSVNETGEEVAQKYGTSQQNVGGIGYESQNMIDLNKEMDRVKSENTGNTLKTVGSGAALGAAAGSIIPGLGTIAGGIIGAGVGLITGIFGGEARKREYRRLLAKQNSKINALQDSARFSAQTKAIQQINAREYGNSEAQYLYGAKDGKLPRYNNGIDASFTKLPVYSQTGKPTFSAFGPVNAKPNAKVSNGEEIVNINTGSAYRIPGKKNNKDTEYAYLNPGDMVVTNKDGLSDYYAMTGDYEGTKEMLKNRLEMAKNGRLPKFDNGWLGNAITSGIGALGGLSQWLEAKNSTPKKTNSYRANPYEGVSLDILSRLGISPFPTMQNLRNAEARANRAIDMSGGLTTGQRTLTRLASLNNTQRAVADALQNIQMQNNNYFADYAKTALAAGAANAQRAMQANMYDEEMYAKAHAARQQGMQMGMRNMIDSIGSYWQNAFKQNQFDRTMNLYQQDIDLKKDEIKALLSNKNAAKSVYPPVMNNYFVNKASKNEKRLRNPFAYTKPATYHDLSGGKWLATPYMYQLPNIPKININTGKYM